MGRPFSGAAVRRMCVVALVGVIAAIPAGSLPIGALRAGPAEGRDASVSVARFAAGNRVPGSPIALRPTQGNADPDGHGYAVPSQFRCGPHVCVHWVITTSDAPPLVDANHDQVPDQVDRTLQAFERAWQVEVIRLGFRAPEPDGNSADHGPNDELDVYLADIGASGLGGYVATDDPHADDDAYEFRDYSAYVVVDDDFATSQLGSSGGSGGLRATAAHEFFHAVQYAYDSSEDLWLTEGTAAWMEDVVADDVNANRRWLRSSALAHPWVPIDSSRGLNEYGSWIFWRFLTESEGPRGPDPTLIRRVWELAADGPGDPNRFSARAVEDALRSRDRSLSGALALFGIWNLAPAAFYREGAAYPVAPVSRRHRVDVRHPLVGWSTLRLNHLTTGAVSFVPEGGHTGASLHLFLDVPPSGSGAAARVLIFLRSGYLRGVSVVLDADGDGDLRVPFSSSQVDHVALVYANASTSFRCWTGAGYSCNGRSRADGMLFRYRAELVR